MLLERAAACGLLRTVALCPEFSHSTCFSLLQRVQSHLSASTSQSSPQQQAHRQAFTQCLAAEQHQSQECTISNSGSSLALPKHSLQQLAHQQQQQQYWPQQQLLQLSSNCNSSLSKSPWSFNSSRCYADAAGGGFGRKRRGLGPRGQMEQRQQPGVSPLATQQQLGRKAALCAPTEQLHQYRWDKYWPDHPKYDPFKDDRSDVRMPHLIDGENDELDASLLLRQQIENSSLPSELKRSILITGPGWDELLLNVKRTVKVTKGGKVETLHALVAVGNADGLIGIGEHSGKNIQKVVMDAQLKAYRNLVAIPRYRQHTVYHALDMKNRKVRMQVWPRKRGFGLTASPLVTQLCELAGISDATIKVTGRRRNIKKVVHTFIEAMLGQSVPHDGVEGTGVYMREVYYGKELPCGLKRGVHVP